MASTRQLTAIMFTDIVGYTASMGKDEERAFDILHKNRQLQKPLIKQYNGHWIKELGDGVLASFPSASEAVLCATEIQKQCNAANDFKLRIGIHQGEIVFEEEDIFGDAVNIASRIQALAPIGGIWISQAIYNDVSNKLGIETRFIKEEKLKNVREPVCIYEVLVEGAASRNTSKVTMSSYSSLSRSLLRLGKPILITFIILSIAAIAYVIYTGSTKKQGQNTQVNESVRHEKSIALLPFKNISNDPHQEYFAEGMMDEVLNHLFKIGGLRITSRTSAMAYKSTKKTMKEISTELGVTNLLEGSVQKEGEKIRIRMQLIDGKMDEQLWAETYDRDFKDVFAIQSDIAQKVAAALKAKINPEVEKRIEFVPTKNMDAYDLYLKANGRKEALEKVIELDTGFADAYSELAIWWLHAGGWNGNIRSEEVLKNALPLLQKALQLNPDLASAHRNAALVYLWYKWDFKAVEKEYQKVVELNPSNTFAGFTDFLLATERFEEALTVTKNALINNRNANLLWGDLAASYYFNNNPQKSNETIETALSLFPEDGYIILNSIRLNVYMNKYEEAIHTFEKYYSTPKEVAPIFLAYIAIAYYKINHNKKGERLLTELKARSRQSPVGSPSFFIAAVYSTLGQNDLAIQWLEKAYNNHEVEMYWLKVEPPFRPMHKDVRFQNIVKRIGYPK